MSDNENNKPVEIHGSALGLGVPPIDESNAPELLYDSEVECGWMYMQREVAAQLRRAIEIATHPCNGDTFSELDCSRLQTAMEIINGTYPKEEADD